MHVGIAHHLGWAVAVTATGDHRVVDRRRVELVDAGLPAAPIHHEGGAHPMHRTGDPLDDPALEALVRTVVDSVRRHSAAALDEIEHAATGAIESISVRDWPDDLPHEIAALRRPPLESRVDSYRYCQILAELAVERGWRVHRYDARTVEANATALLGTDADHVLSVPRAVLGPPWAKDHRTALAATVLAAAGPPG